MKLRKLNFIIIFLLVFLFQDCKHEPFDCLECGDQITGGGLQMPEFVNEVCDPQLVYFEPTIQNLLVSHCAMQGCHNSTDKADGFDVTSYHQVMAEVKAFDPLESDLFIHIDTSALYDDKKDLEDIMPKGDRPFDGDQIKLIERWIEQGALENSCTPCDTSNIVYADMAEMVRMNCRGCHNGRSDSWVSLDLTNEQTFRNVATRALKNMLEQEDQKNFMPKYGHRNNCNILKLHAWIKDSMP